MDASAFEVFWESLAASHRLENSPPGKQEEILEDKMAEVVREREQSCTVILDDKRNLFQKFVPSVLLSFLCYVRVAPR